MSLWTIDFTTSVNQVFIIIYFAVTLFLIWLKQHTFAGFMLTIAGILMALNSINIVLCLVIMALGVIIITMGGET